MKVLSVDVSSERLNGFDGAKKLVITNERRPIARMLKGYSSEWVLVLEPTSIYHLEIAEQAYALGMTVYLVNPRVISKFREMRSRAKTDEIDAECLHAFCMRNHEDLRPWSPLPPALEKLRSAIKRHHKTVQIRGSLAQSLAAYPCPELEASLKELTALVERLQADAVQAAKDVDEDYYERVLEMPGVGPCCACAYTFVLRSRNFEDADAVRAFLGLELRVADSGKKKGRRCVSHLGDSTLRYIACISGRSLLNSKFGRQMNNDLKARGRHGPERAVIATRKQIRTAFALSKTSERFDPNKFTWRLDTKT